MQTLKSWLNLYSESAETDDQSNNNHQLRLLLQHLLNQSPAWVYTHPEYQLNEYQVEQLGQWLRDLKSGKPLAYITGKQMFWDLNLKVNKHTLIPRPDTEIIIETTIELLANRPPHRILDLGTGSGALALVLARLFPEAEITAVDQSKEALQVATENAKRYNLTHIEFIKSNWFTDLVNNPFDLIVSNPPYISEDDVHLNDLQHEPRGALVAAKNGLADYLSIVESAFDFLTKGGMLVFEHGWQQKHDVKAILAASGFVGIDCRKDLAGRDRVTFGVRTED